MKKLLLILATAGVLSVTTAVPALAQIPPHSHSFTPPGQDESHQIARGTGTCESNPTALNNFHENVHTDVDDPVHPLGIGGRNLITADELSCPPA
jgi:hypothetical protein